MGQNNQMDLDQWKNLPSSNTTQISSSNLIIPKDKKNDKGQFINSIAFLSELNGINLKLVRLNDYNLMRQNQL